MLRLMIARASILVVLLTTLILPATGCKKGPDNSAYATMLVGVWEDSGAARYTFEKVQGKVVPTHVVDSDGEVFPVEDYGWTDDGIYYWTYKVPSTGYLVTHRIMTLSDTELNAEWANQYDSGDDTFTKVQ